MKKIPVALIITCLFLAGCGQEKKSVEIGQPAMDTDKTQQNSAGSESSKEIILRKAKKEEVGTTVVCSVMGSEFTIKEHTWVAEYKGKTYPFCCDRCIKSFSDNPDKYAE